MASAFGLRPFRSEAVSASARVTWSLSMILNVSLLGRLRVETSTKLNKKEDNDARIMVEDSRGGTLK